MTGELCISLKESELLHGITIGECLEFSAGDRLVHPSRVSGGLFYMGGTPKRPLGITWLLEGQKPCMIMGAKHLHKTLREGSEFKFDGVKLFKGHCHLRLR